MEIIGKIIQVNTLEIGENKNLKWKRQGFVIATMGQYVNKVYLTAWGNKFNYSLLTVGNEVILECDAQSKEFKGKWYTNINARNVNLMREDTLPFQSSDTSLPF